MDLPRTRILYLSVLASLSSAVCAQTWIERPSKKHVPLDGPGRSPSAFGDVDRDGDLDVVIGTAQGRKRLLLNDGSGIFSDAGPSVMPSDSDQTYAVVFLDVDGDRDLDLVLGNNGARTRLYVNDGSGRFSDATTSKMPPDFFAPLKTTWAVAAVDVDRDGDLDLALAVTGWSPGSGGCDIYLNDGRGNFSASTSQVPAYGPMVDVIDADVDRDGDQDLLLASQFPHSLTLLRNDGRGNFTNVNLGPPPLMPSRLAAGDVDGDGDSDMVLTNESNQCWLYLNDGSGRFTDATAGRMPLVRLPTQSVRLLDVDGDRDLDVVLGTHDRGDEAEVRLFLNDGRGIFADRTSGRMPPVGESVSQFVGGDVDADGDTDLLLVCAGTHPRRLLLNDGSGTFTDASGGGSARPFRRVSTIAVGDFDGDGDVDVVAAIYVAGEKLFLNDARGSFAEAPAGRLPVTNQTASKIVGGDVDGDGDLDLVLARSGPMGHTALYLNDGTGRFTEVTASRLPRDNESTDLALGDLDGDGDLDMLLSGTPHKLYLNDGAGRVVLGNGGFSALDGKLVLGDVDADGDQDLMVSRRCSQKLLFLNNGQARFTDATAAKMPVDGWCTVAMALGDVDGDRDLDVVLANLYEENRLYINIGPGNFVDQTAGRMPGIRNSAVGLALSDIDGDGDLDVVLGSDKSQLLSNDGTGNFTAAGRLIADGNVAGETFAFDLDSDGDPDVTFGHARGFDTLVNLRQQTGSPLVARLGRPLVLEFSSRLASATAPQVAIPFLAPASGPSIQVPPFGSFSLLPSRTLVLTPVYLAAQLGRASLVLPIPADPSLAGAAFFSQALVLPSPSLGDARFTNAIGEVMRRL